MDEDAFLRAILASPHDDAPRLIYADWLEERGDPRGEYIRLLCALDGLPGDDARAVEMRERLQALEARIDLSWRALLSRGRRPRGQEAATRPSRRGRRSRRDAREADVALFLRQYARKAERTGDPNDRRYNRAVEETVKRMKPEELDRLMRGEED
jgi:uncharacterized protein (TIGR02996 family)